jgi:hypothetical protein
LFINKILTPQLIPKILLRLKAYQADNPLTLSHFYQRGKVFWQGRLHLLFPAARQLERNPLGM